MEESLFSLALHSYKAVRGVIVIAMVIVKVVEDRFPYCAQSIAGPESNPSANSREATAEKNKNPFKTDTYVKCPKVFLKIDTKKGKRNSYVPVIPPSILLCILRTGRKKWKEKRKKKERRKKEKRKIGKDICIIPIPPPKKGNHPTKL